MWKEHLNRFIFEENSRKLSRVLLGIFLLSTSVFTYFVCKNPTQFIVYHADGVELNLPEGASDLIAAIDLATTAEEKQQAMTKYKQDCAAASSTSETTLGAGSSLSSSLSSSSSSTSDDGSSTPPAAPESSSAFVAFYSYNQSDSDADDLRHQNVANRILTSRANPVINAGDIMEDGTQDSWNRFLNIAGTLLATRTFYAALGNNDRVVGDSTTPLSYFLDYFNLPNNERWYSVNSGNLHIIILDSAFGASDPNQLS